MKQICALALLILLSSAQIQAQSSETPCDLQTRAVVGMCIDSPCIPVFGYVQGGTPPYQYQWFNGDTGAQTYLNYGTDPSGLDTCLTLTVTDAAGCIAIASVRYQGGYQFGTPPNQFPMDSTFLANDTVTLANTGGNFDVGGNDHVFAQNYTVVQPPRHGDLVLHADGTGTYTPQPGWCGPDYFRYTATDTGGCRYARLATVRVEPTPCAGILAEKTDCNQSCGGRAWFYQNGVLTSPFTYSWSDGSTGAAAEGLCSGPVSVTVTDALGQVQTYSGSIGSSTVAATIQGPGVVCNGTVITLGADISLQNAANYTYYWSGPGIYGGFQFAMPAKPYCSSTSDSAVYQLHVRSNEGCEITAKSEVDILPPVNIDLKIESPQCPGDTLEIRPRITKPGTPPYSYTWSGPQGVQSNWPALIWPAVTAAFSGAYSLTVTDQNGCSGTRKATVSIPDSCGYEATILDKGITYCTGSDILLRFTMNPTLAAPEKLTWTGPNGFSSHAQSPILHDVEPAATGWYHLSMQLGSTLLSDSVYYTVAPDVLEFVSVSVTPPLDCFTPYDGVMSLTMSAPPPYLVKFPDMGSSQTVNTNPIVRTNMKDGLHTIKVKKNGCETVNNIRIEAPAPPQISVQAETCTGNDAAISVSAAHPLSIFWKNADGSSLNTNQPVLSGAAPGVYTVYVQDQTTKCIFRDTLFLAPYLDFEVSVVDTPACTTSDGSLLAAPSGNVVPPVSYAWNTGSADNPLSGLAPGGYSVSVTDGDGCSRHRNVVLGPEEACIAQVTGQILVNASCLCSSDTNTVIFPFAKVCATNGFQTTCTYAENTGQYALALTEPGLYVITASSWLPNAQIDCPAVQYTVGTDITQDTAGVDFYFCAAPESDLQTALYCDPARPGFPFSTSVQVRNNGIWTADTSLLTVHLSPYLAAPNFFPPPESYDPVAHTAVWRIAQLALYQQFNVKITGTVTAALNDVLTIQAAVHSLITPDHYPTNNQSECSTPVTGSIDPNDKTVNPIGAGTFGNISPNDSLLTYTIRFQNTGTDTAFTVVVRDTLDAQVFDLNSIAPLQSSHPYHLRLESDNILVFTFDPIRLPDSNRTVEGSKGFVMFDIRLKKFLRKGTRIANSAAIYFDYNAPVITNTVQNTVVAVTEPAPAFPNLSLRPNPASGRTLLTLENTDGLQWIDVTLFSLDGALSRHVAYRAAPPAGTTIPIDAQGLAAGMYLVSVKSNLGQVSKKLSVIAD